jgi:2',3'-cyclic-nucleotide 2'-phosphodiesterase
MKILFVGEIVASPGRKTVAALLPGIIKNYSPDLVVANAENLSGGRGVTKENLDEMRKVGIDYFTGGDHVFWQKDSEEIFESLPIVRPANLPEGTAPGKGYTLLDAGSKGSVLLINLMGRTSFSNAFAYLDDPFKKADQILAEFKNEKLSAIIIDFHAEATSEKAALGHYLDGRVTAIVGTHTHIPTADGMALPKGTLFVTDVGMVGAVDSVLGVKSEIVINQFLTARNQRFEWEEHGRRAFRSVLFDTDLKTVTRIDNLS